MGERAYNPSSKETETGDSLVLFGHLLWTNR